MKSIIKTASLLASAFLLISAVAFADSHTEEDGDDSNIALDVARAKHGHVWEGGRRNLVHTFEMVETWTNDAISQHSLVLFISADANGRAERQAAIHVNPDDSLYGRLWKEGDWKGYARVWRSNERTVKIIFPRSFIGASDFYRWRVIIQQDGVHCDGGACMEIVPNEGTWITHQL